MQVAALAEHPEEVGDVEIIVGGSDQAAPDLPRALRDVEGDEQSSVLQLRYQATQNPVEQLSPCLS